MVTKTSCSFSSRSVKDAAQILRWDRGDEQLTPSSGTGVHCQRLHQNNAAFLYDKRQFHGLKGKLGRVCQIPGWSWVWSSVDSWENLFSKSSSSLNTQEKTNLLWYPFLTCSLSLSSGHTGGWNLYQKHPLRWFCSEHGTWPVLSPPGIQDGRSQMEAIPARMTTYPWGAAVNSSNHTELLLDWEDSRVREIHTQTSMRD